VLVAPGDPQASVLPLRMRSRHPQHQMPPLGTRLTDDEGLALVERWIQTDLLNRKEHQP
jgi:mono/diheme cytochrome c family protein